MRDLSKLALIYGHSGYWRKNQGGYTNCIGHAGIYGREEAEKIAAGCGPEKGVQLCPVNDDHPVIVAEARDEAQAQAQVDADNSAKYGSMCLALEAHAADLRGALEEIGQDCDNPSEAKVFDPESGETCAVWVIEADRLRGTVLAALASTPAQSLALVKAGALREAAEYATGPTVTLPLPDQQPTGEYVLYGDRCRVAVAHGLIAWADRLEKEATNG